MGARCYRTGSGYWFIFRLDGEDRPLQGTNRIEVLLLERDRVVTPQIYLRDVELEVKYLMGKNFHRGFVDADLGAHELAPDCR
jgi:hypothetical protein